MNCSLFFISQHLKLFVKDGVHPVNGELHRIGMNKLRELTEDEQCQFMLFVGTSRLIKRRLFEQYLEQAYSI